MDDEMLGGIDAEKIEEYERKLEPLGFTRSGGTVFVYYHADYSLEVRFDCSVYQDDIIQQVAVKKIVEEAFGKGFRYKEIVMQRQLKEIFGLSEDN